VSIARTGSAHRPLQTLAENSQRKAQY